MRAELERATAFTEAEVAVRIEIVHALAAQGALASATLDRIGRADPDAGVRVLARSYARAP